MHYVIARVRENLLVSEIANQIDVPEAIEWVVKARKEVNAEKIKNCFAKCGFTEETSEIEDDIVDEEFNALFKDLADLDCQTTVEEYIDFDVETCTLVPEINSDTVDWRVSSVQKCVAEYLRKESRKDDDDDDDVAC